MIVALIKINQSNWRVIGASCHYSCQKTKRLDGSDKSDVLKDDRQIGEIINTKESEAAQPVGK